MNIFNDILYNRMQSINTATAVATDSPTTNNTAPKSPVSKALREASERKARKLHFYQNGKPYDARLTVSIIPGKEFLTLEQLYQFLTEKTKLLNGVQYIFTINGELITSLEELEHDQTYIISGSKHFIPFPYGSSKPNPARLPNTAARYRSIREDDLRLIRPLSSKYNNVYSSANSHNNCYGSNHNHCNGGYYYYGSSIPQNREIRQVTIVNNKNHDIYTKVILNLKSPKSFDLLLNDLGDAVQMKSPKIMFTCNGQMVKSVSHLKHELGHINLFYIDNEYPHEALWLYEELYQGSPFHMNSWSQTTNDCQLCDGFPFSPVPVDPVMQNHTNSPPALLNQQPQQPQTQHPIIMKNDEITPIYSPKMTNESRKPSSTNSRATTSLLQTKSPQNLISDPSSTNLYSTGIPSAYTHPQTFVDKPRKMPEVTFGVEQLPISPEKYEQIQTYVEKLLNETSFQIQNEGLLKQTQTEEKNKSKKVVRRQSRSPQRKQNSIPKSHSRKFTKDLTQKSPIKHPTKTRTSVAVNINGNINKFGGNQRLNRVESEKLKKNRNDLNSSKLSIQEKYSSKKSTLPSLSKSTERINETSKFLSKSNLDLPRFNLTKSTDKIHESTIPTLKEKSPERIQSMTKLNEVKHSKKTIHTSSENLKTTKKPPVSPSASRLKKSDTSLNRQKPEQSDSNSSLNKIGKTGAKSKSSDNLSQTNSKTQAQKYQEELNLKFKLKDIEKFLHGNHCPPPYHLVLDKIFGYNGRKLRNLVYLTNTGELAYYSGIFAILWNHSTGTQRFYTEHEGDICCLRVDPACECIATGHLTHTAMIIRIWSIKTLKTIKILTNKKEFVDMEFTKSNTLFILTGGKESNLSLWNWRLKVNMSNTSKSLDHNEQVFGLTVHPLESDIVVTYGKMHLVVWHFKKDRTIECRTALQMQSKIAKTIHCAEFLNDNSLLTGDSMGNLTIWAPFEVNKVLEFAIKEVKGHESQLTCFKLTKENILISGDKDGAIKTWDVNDNEFRLLNAVKLPSASGSVTSITLPNKLLESITIFIGTSNSLILKGSALQTEDYQIIFEGHFMAIRTVSIDIRNNIYTSSLDRKICKWNTNGLIWKTDSNVQGMSSTVHPNGQVLAVGSANGIVIIVNTSSGEALQYIQLTSVCIGCMSYAPNGNFLVAGCQDGSLHVIPVADNGKSYDKVSILKGPLPILTLQWSMDTQFILTSVDDNNFQELILWDLPNTRYIRNVTSFSDNLQWYNVTCSGLEDARGTWDNEKFKDVVNICKNYSPNTKCIVTGDENGYVRLFAYPSFDTKASYFQYKQGGGSVTDVKFSQKTEDFIISANYEGSIFLWKMMEYQPKTNEPEPEKAIKITLSKKKK